MSLQVAKPILGRFAPTARLKEVRCAAKGSGAYADSPVLTLLVPMHAGKSGFIGMTKGPVAAVFSPCHQSKVGPAVVIFDSVNMVKFLGRILRQMASLIEPGKSVHIVKTASNTNPAVSLVVVTSRIADMNVVTRPTQVSKYARCWVVMKQVSKVFLGQVHGVLQYVCGLGARQRKTAVSCHYTPEWER